MYEYMYVAVIQRGGSGNCFPGGNLRGGKHSKLRSPFFPLALPLSGHAFFERTLWCVMRFVWGDGFDCIGNSRLSRWMRADGKRGPHSGPVP